MKKQTKKPETASAVDAVVMLPKHLEKLEETVEIFESLLITIKKLIAENKKISAVTRMEFESEHSDIMSLLQKHQKNDESYYRTLERLIDEGT